MRSMLTLLLLSTLAACGGDTTTPDDDDDEPQEDHTEEFEVPIIDASRIVGYTVASDATGSATFSFDTITEVLSFTVNVSNMDQIIGAHVHAPASATQNAGIPLILYAPDAPTGTVNGQLVSGTIEDGSPLIIAMDLQQILDLMREERAFVMIHSSSYPDGEIRGQVEFTDSTGI